MQRDNTTGTTIGKHNGETRRETTEKSFENKKMYVFFCVLNCFEIMSVCKSKEKMKITERDDLGSFFLKMSTSPKSSGFATVGSRTSPQQRGSATG